MTVLAVIPARGGSRGIPSKNLAVVGGDPLVVRAIKAALAAETVNRVVVSTDSEPIELVAVEAGAQVVRRPDGLATDEASTESALLHVLDALSGQAPPEYVVTLEPTSPFRTAATIDACVRRAYEVGADALITVSETHDVLGRFADGVFSPLELDQPRRRQLRVPFHREVGTVYVTRTAHLRRAESVFAEPLYAVLVSEEEGLDINTPLDLIRARSLADSLSAAHQELDV